MKLDRTTKILFGQYPREVANPQRREIKNEKQMVSFIDQNNGVRDCYVSLYPTSSNPKLVRIDKIYFDIDSPDPSDLTPAFEETKQLYKWLIENQYKVIPLISGKKGFTLHMLTRSKIYEAQRGKNLLRNATYHILCCTFGHEHGKIKAQCIDSHVIGDIRRIVRIPDTQRPPENLNWCTYLPEDFPSMTLAEVIKHGKAPHSYTYHYSPDLPSILPYLESFSEAPISVMIQSAENRIEPEGEDEVEIKGNLLLQNVLRPCLYRHMMKIHPIHSARVASTVDLLGFFSENEIFKIYKSLQWTEWDSEITAKQIASCRHLKPYSCTKLRQLGIPRECCID